MSFPHYDELLEEVPGFPCSWAYFNSMPGKDGAKDELGTLNFLTPDTKVRAASEIKKGISISLDLPVDYFADVSTAFGGRKPPEHAIKHVAPFICEDSLTFNTQSASQWDGFRHFGIRKTHQFYNGRKSADFATDPVIGINAWVTTGSIVGRGVLIDFHSWAEATQTSVNPNAGYAITLDQVLAVLAHQRTEILPGDILIFRTGWLAWYNSTTATARHDELCVRNLPGAHAFIGLSQERSLVAWLWNNKIAAVAGDQVAFECTPPPHEGFGWLHEHLLSALGCPIGELWNLEELAEICKTEGRWSFFCSSAPLHIKGGVASPANVVAVL